MSGFNYNFNDIQKQIAFANLTDEQITDLISILQTKRNDKSILTKEEKVCYNIVKNENFYCFFNKHREKKSLINGVNCMKKLISLLGVLVYFVFIFTACSKNLTEKSDIISLYQNNEETFLQAANSGDYSTVENIRGVQSVYISEKHVDISCGGVGFGPSTHYYGIFYSADGDMCAIDVAGPEDELVESGDGYLYQESDGDNRYYVEALGNNFYYYEADF